MSKKQFQVLMISGIIFCISVYPIWAQFVDFPYTVHQHDISVDHSEMGASFLKIRGYFGKNNDSMDQYKLLWKQYDIHNNFIRFDTTAISEYPVFHFQRKSLNFYEFCIVALDSKDRMIDATKVQSVNPSQLINQSRKKTKQNRSEPLSSPSDIELKYEIDHQSFPYINLLAQITMNDIPFDGKKDNYPLLEHQNFTVYEDQRLQPIRELLPPEPLGYSKIADIVIIHDDSGSLDDEAAQVKENINLFVNNLSQSGIDYRIGLLPYGGSGKFSDPKGTILHNGILSSETDTFLNDVDQMQFDGGTENAFCALELAIESIVWRPSTQKVIILVTDEGPDPDGCPLPEAEIIEALCQSNIVVYVLTDGQQEFDGIADATNGKVYNITANFNSILNEIGADIVARYIVQYESDNTLLDGTQRFVDLNVWAVNDQNAKIETSITKTYTPTPPIRIQLTSETQHLSTLGQRKNKALHIIVNITQGKTTDWDDISAKLHYQNQNQSFQTMPMVHLTSGIYKATIPSNEVLDPFIHYYISATDGTVTSTLPSVDPTDNAIVIAVLPNFAPVITHTPVINAVEGVNIAISARIEDATNRVSKVQLLFRKNGEYNYRIITKAVNDTSVNFTEVISKEYVTANGVEYYLSAEDDYGVNQTFGSPDQPIQIFVTSEITNVDQKDIGNITVYADSFIQDSLNSHIWVASGNVRIGTKSSGNHLISISTSVQMDYSTLNITGISAGDLVALQIKRNPFKGIENIPVYYGNFEIDCVPIEPILKMINGDSKLRLIGNLPFLFPYANNQLTIQDDQLIIHDVTAHITQGFNILLTIGDIVLSQKGASMSPITISGSDLLNQYPLSLNPKWSLSNLAFEVDLFREYIKGSGEFNIEGLIGSETAGLGATFGFLYDPFAIETLGGNLSFPSSLQQILTIPPTPPSLIGVRIDGGSFIVDNITSSFDGLAGLQLQGTCSARLVDSFSIADAFEHVTGYKIISGELALLIDLSGQVELSGQVKLLEHIKLAGGNIGIGNPTYISGNIDIMDILLGNVYLAVSSSNSYLIFVGKNQLTLQIPTYAPWIGGYELTDIDNDATIKLTANGIDQADFRSSYKLFFIDLAIRLDISNPHNPNLYITGWDKTIQVFRKRTKRDANQISFTISEPYQQIIVKIDSASNAPLFNLTFPDKTIYTPENASLESLANNVNDIFFIRNTNAHEAYYAINNPLKGNYKIDITNTSDIGAYNLHILGPNSKPEIALTCLSDNLTWDGASPVEITWTGNDIDNNAKISLYYDTDNFGNNGYLIVDGIMEDSGIRSYQWQISENMQPGNYYIYAQIDDSENAPIFVYSSGFVSIENEQAPSCPENVLVSQLDGEIEVRWDPVSDDNLAGYRVYLSETSQQNQPEYHFSTGINTKIVIPGLVNSKAYDVEVSAVNTNGFESVRSPAQNVILDGNATGGTPDLTLNLTHSSVSLSNNPNVLQEKLSIDAQIDNTGHYDAYSADIFCYFGSMAQHNLIGKKMISEIKAGESVLVKFEIETSKIANRPDQRNIIIHIDNVLLPELNTNNNIGIIHNELEFQIDKGISVPTGDGKSIKVFLLEGQLKSVNAFHPENITTTENRPDNLPYGLFDTRFETTVGGVARIRIEFPAPLPSNVQWFKFMNNQWQDYSDVVFNSQKTEAIITLHDGGTGDDDGIQNGVIIDPAGPGAFNVIEGTSDDDNGNCFISIL
ncbi:MAG: hypothetical protein OMM_01665 [Candidatus Magnetoglobus multicellularis str. Araruama]|uniref:VWA domain-containing protein n=1 Tax=Candidatus Magnetoglobus multicellularis str. Araruama TaxID=890399 RepID=A0A1V1PCJ3_9BACT|nr:MAG: hypothetical protein OMM_01665 [Candidatus Magnetoglobus multicellularis str. Araruama]